MANSIFPFGEHSVGGVPDDFTSMNNYFESMEGTNGEEQMHYRGCEDWLCSDNVFYQDDPILQEGLFISQNQLQGQQKNSLFDYKLLDDMEFDMFAPQLPPCLNDFTMLGEIQNSAQDIVEPSKEKHDSFGLTSYKLLNNFSYWFKRLSSERIMEPIYDAPCTMVVANQEFSAEEIMRIAGARFIQSSTDAVDVASLFDKSFLLSFSGLSDEAARNVEIAEFLLAAAEKVGDEQFERASRLLNQCDYLSSYTGNPVQRVVHYFSRALRERIDRKTGSILASGKMHPHELEKTIMAPTPNILECYQELPFCQVPHFTGIQAILEQVADSKRVHVIDIGIKAGIQWTIFMQALVTRSENPLEHLKITAINTTSGTVIKDIGKRLTSYAETIGLPFSFNMVLLPDMLELKEEHIKVESDETVAVYTEYLLRSLIPMPDHLDFIMRVIRKLNPCIMVVTEIELNTASPAFINRFIEALFFFSAYFDSLEACMKRDNINRIITESLHFGEGIRNIVATEGEERKIRNVKINVWRAFFARFGMEEIELSTAGLCQANLVVKNFSFGSCCTLEMDGKALLIGWKGTPIHSLSVWKFPQEV